jgi:hypothetical protein
LSISRSAILLFLPLLFLASLSRGQSSFQGGLLPEINLNIGLSGPYSLNANLESRQELFRGAFGDTGQTRYDYVLTDASLILARKVGLANKVAAGYLIRFRNGEVHHRLIQQFTLVSLWGGLRLGHRLAADQTFVPEEKVSLRLRYRLAAEFPLNGAAVDPGEFYLKANAELLQILQGADYSLEGRLAPFLGYAITDRNKIEAGLDYRQGTLLRPGSRHSFWWSMSWYIKI